MCGAMSGKRQLCEDPMEESHIYPSTFQLDSFYTRLFLGCKKSARLPIKEGRPALVKGIDF
jgi:hypothetical protein